MVFLQNLLAIMLLALCQIASGAPSGSGSDAIAAAVQAEPVSRAEFTVATRRVFVFRATLQGHAPQDRAEAAERRLAKALAQAGPQRTGVHAIAEGVQVLLDGAPLFLVTPDDINGLAGDTTIDVARDSAARLERALTTRREASDPRVLIEAAVLCIGATLAYMIVLRALVALRSAIKSRFERLLSVRLARVSFRNVRLLDTQHYVGFLRQVTMALVWSLRLLATYIWISFLLGEFAYTRSWGEWLKGYLVEMAVNMGQSMAAAIPGLLVVLVIAMIARLVILTAGSVFMRVESGELEVGWLDQDTAAPTRRLVNIVIVLFALAMAYPYLPGSHTAAFQGVTVLAGLMVSIGASSIVAQGAAGLILMYTRSLRKGEYVRVGEKEGTVVELGMFETRLRTGSGEEVLMPNAWVLLNTTSNFSRDHDGDGFVTEVKVTVGYDTPWRQVHALLDEAARATPGIATQPAPFIVQSALSDFYIEYRLCAHAAAQDPRGRAEVRNRLHQQVLDVFDAHGVRLTSPHYQHVALREGWPAP
ncbi:mechanosensitive ion channel domain-containing protein [Massilia aurea]|uniref:mechanosensitive ion channel family protein n=1 Tax=Massilia aurea TaxID=373040 RepID=UPI0034636DCB